MKHLRSEQQPKTMAEEQTIYQKLKAPISKLTETQRSSNQQKRDLNPIIQLVQKSPFDQIASTPWPSFPGATIQLPQITPFGGSGGVRPPDPRGHGGKTPEPAAKQPQDCHFHPSQWLISALTGISIVSAAPALAQPQPLRAIVNSNQDGPAQADDILTLREAILLMNGTLPLTNLSAAEQAQVSQLPTDSSSRIDFNLPAGETTIRLLEVLPAITRPQLVIDGTTQPGYNSKPVINERPIPMPIVAITPAPGKEVFRGLTITADFVTIRGFSLYGFTSSQGEYFSGFASGYGSTQSTPPADIFISHRFPPPDTRKQQPPANFSPYYSDDLPPRQVVIENNWLGMAPMQATGDGQQAIDTLPTPPNSRSAFGVSVFNGTGTTIQRNWIAYHDGSAIITSVNASELNIAENVITGNGIAGMPDAIRLEGNVNQAQIAGNLICANDGSGVYLFKPEGAVRIRENQIIYNGRRLRRAAIYLMGNDHEVKGNEIRYQTGPGVAVAAYPESDRNQIQTNRFSSLEGLSIDLVTRQGATAGTDVHDYQIGDGPNPPRNSFNRHKDTGNAAIHAPQFASQEFVALGNSPVQIYGTADPGSQIELYRVAGNGSRYGPLNEPVATAMADEKGHFSASLDGLRIGEKISAIATHPRYGTSEPARNATIRSVEAPTSQPPIPQSPSSIPRCTTPVVQEPPAVIPPTPVTIQIPNVIHFALDKSNISPATARVLDRIAQVLLENPSMLVEIVGHTDPRATDAYNLALGQRRALAARNYLLKRGIAPERMTIRSEGERQLVSTGRTRLDFARDRRVEFFYKDAREIEVIIQEEDLQIEP
ncbi:OmpA family protein [Leptothermofonsia sp. ETS-13]|uniref:OmpA family protein n=1 Tax=Leptothermofonsia sp. ETS-13 TaxID=3035696 RepID=UPI003BA2E7D6